MNREGCFDFLYGRHCNDNDWDMSSQEAGNDPDAFFFLKLRKEGLYPVIDRLDSYSEDDLFSVIEFLHDYVAQREDGAMRHNWCSCGGCDPKYNAEQGQARFRQEMNDILADYSTGYFLSEKGEILARAEPGIESLMQAPLPEYDPHNVEDRVEAAIRQFRNRHLDVSYRRNAVRELADVLEFLSKKAEAVLKRKDESELFKIANNFCIRHHNPVQNGDYDGSIWLPWVFYLYLDTIHVWVRLLKCNKHSNG